MSGAEPIHPEIIALTQRWVVVFKPSGWLTIPGRSVLNRQVNPDTNRQEEASHPPVLSEWIRKQMTVLVVHRLDLETSGVVLFARTAKDHQEANLWFQQKKMKKIYHCLADGTPYAPIMKIKKPIQEFICTTQVEVCESYFQGFFAKILPLSGKRHQIRIHLSSHGFPIFGDTRYGGVREVLYPDDVVNTPPLKSIYFSRCALHASSLQLPTGEIFEAPLPEDFLDWLSQLRMV